MQFFLAHLLRCICSGYALERVYLLGTLVCLIVNFPNRVSDISIRTPDIRIWNSDVNKLSRTYL